MKQVANVTENELLAAIQNDDDSALKLIYRQHYQFISNMVIKNGGSFQESKDIYQETLIVFYEKAKDTNFTLNCSIRTFLYSIARRLWLKQLQRKSKFTDEFKDTDEFVNIPEDQSDQKEDLYNAMHLALEALGEPCRSILKDFYLNSQSMEVITEKFGYTNADNTKNQKYKCLKRLKKSFFDAYNLKQ